MRVLIIRELATGYEFTSYIEDDATPRTSVIVGELFEQHIADWYEAGNKAFALRLAKSDDVKALAYAMIAEQRDWARIPSLKEDTDLILATYGNEVWIVQCNDCNLNNAVKLAKVDYSLPGWDMIEGD